MKALTICQPYAELIIRGDKPVENRTWYCRYRGPLLIHAGKSRDWLDTWEPMEGLDFGAIIGSVNVVDCGRPSQVRQRHANCKENVHVEGPFCIVVAEPRRLVVPIPYRGALGLFDVPDEVLAGAEWRELPGAKGGEA